MEQYKNMAFCPFWIDCKTYPDLDCPKALTDEVKKEAKEASMSIIKYTIKPDCFEDIPF